MHLILTGGAGYIGSHVAVDVLSAGHDVTIIDNFVNSHPESISRIVELTGKNPDLIEADLAGVQGLEKIRTHLKGYHVDGAIHMAGLKAVAESVAQPAHYYDVNINATLNLMTLLEELSATRLVFSSSATVYGGRNKNPVQEAGACFDPANPYGRSKYFIELILSDLCKVHDDWQVMNLRYFNPVGAHPSGRIGEDPQGTPNNLFPYTTQVLSGQRDELLVFGDDYGTLDGTGVRDYIHVIDLSAGHLAAMEYLSSQTSGCLENINLGTGKGYSVLQVIKAFEKVSGMSVPYKIAPRRAGDVAEVYADPSRAESLLTWKAEKSLEEMCTDHWVWQKLNPKGYAG